MVISTGDIVSASGAFIDSDKVEGTAVYDANKTKIGTIDRLVIEKVSGKVAYAVMTFGGFLGLGTDDYTIPWGKLNYDKSVGGYRADVSEQQVKGSPSFYRETGYTWGADRAGEKQLHDYWGVPWDDS